MKKPSIRSQCPVTLTLRNSGKPVFSQAIREHIITATINVVAVMVKDDPELCEGLYANIAEAAATAALIADRSLTEMEERGEIEEIVNPADDDR